MLTDNNGQLSLKTASVCFNGYIAVNKSSTLAFNFSLIFALRITVKIKNI